MTVPLFASIVDEIIQNYAFPRTNSLVSFSSSFSSTLQALPEQYVQIYLHLVDVILHAYPTAFHSVASKCVSDVQSIPAFAKASPLFLSFLFDRLASSLADSAAMTLFLVPSVTDVQSRSCHHPSPCPPISLTAASCFWSTQFSPTSSKPSKSSPSFITKCPC